MPYIMVLHAFSLYCMVQHSITRGCTVYIARRRTTAQCIQSFLEEFCWNTHPRKCRAAAEDQQKQFHDLVSQFEDFQQRTRCSMGKGDIQEPKGKRGESLINTRSLYWAIWVLNSSFIIIVFQSGGDTRTYQSIPSHPIIAQYRSCDGEQELGILRFQDHCELNCLVTTPQQVFYGFKFVLKKIFGKSIIFYFFDGLTPSLQVW